MIFHPYENIAENNDVTKLEINEWETTQVSLPIERSK